MLPLKGNRFGFLTALHYVKGSKWHCICDCGNTVDVDTNSLTAGRTKSCGCYQKLVTKLRSERGENPDRVDAVLRRLYVAVKTRHVNKLGFSVSDMLYYDEWKALVVKPCVYCGREPFRERYDTKSDTIVKVNGLDRIDSSKGYSLDNVVTCCRDCNIAKSDMNLNQFVDFVSRLANNLESIKKPSA